MTVARPRAAPTRIALRLTAVHTASGSERSRKGVLPANRRPSVRSPSLTVESAASVIHTTSTAVSTRLSTPQTIGERRSGDRGGERTPAGLETVEREGGEIEDPAPA